MPFVINSAGTITQPATDTDLNLQALSLVLVGGNPVITTTISGAGATSHTTYHMGNMRLEILGTLSMDPERETLIFGGTGRFLVNQFGVFNYGRVISPVAPAGRSTTLPAPVGDRVSIGCGIIINNTSASLSTQVAPFVVVGDATMNWNGGEISCAGTMRFVRDAIVNIRDGVIRLTTGIVARFENSPTLTVDGLIKIGGFLYLQNGAPINFSRYESIHSNDAQSQAGRNPYGLLAYGINPAFLDTVPLSAVIPAPNYIGTGNVVDAAIIDNAFLRLDNPESGVNLRTDTWLGVSTRSDGRIAQHKAIEYEMLNLATGQPADGINILFRDTDNGSRVNNANQIPPNNPIGATDTEDQIAVAVSASGTANLNPLYRVTTALNGVVNRDTRSLADGTIRSTIFHYNFLTQPEVDTDSAGTGGANTLVGLTVDENISETVEANAAAYSNRFTVNLPSSSVTVIGTGATLDNLYDYVKYSHTRPSADTVKTSHPIEYSTGGGTATARNLAPAGSVLGTGGFLLTINGELTNGNRFNTLDLGANTIIGTSVTGTIDGLSLSNIANNQTFGSVINSELSSLGSNAYRVNGSASGSILEGRFNIGDGATLNGTNLNGELVRFAGINSTLTLTDVTFGANFTVPPGASGSGNAIQPAGSTVISPANTALFIAAGYTVNTPAITETITLPAIANGRHQTLRIINGIRIEDTAQDIVAGTDVQMVLSDRGANPFVAGRDTASIRFKFDSVVGGDTYQEQTFTYTFAGDGSGATVPITPPAATVTLTSNATASGTTFTDIDPVTELFSISGAEIVRNQMQSMGAAIEFANTDDYFDAYLSDRGEAPLFEFLPNNGIRWRIDNDGVDPVFTFQSGTTAVFNVVTDTGGTANVVIPTRQLFSNWEGEFGVIDNRGGGVEVESVAVENATLTQVTEAANLATIPHLQEIADGIDTNPFTLEKIGTLNQ